MAGISFLTVSCSSDDVQPVAEEERVPIQLCAAVDGLQLEEVTETRAPQGLQDDYFAVGELINVFIEEIVPENGTMTGNYGTSAIEFRVTGEGSATGIYSMRPTALSYPYFPTNANHVKLYGFYPNTVKRSTTSFAVKSDQDGNSNYKASDLMYSNNVTDQHKTTNAVQMQFNHMLAKINLNMTYGGGTAAEKERLEGTKVSLTNVYLRIAMDASEDNLTFGEIDTDSKGTITVTNNARYESSCILPPQKVRPSNFMKIRTGSGDILNFRLPQTMEFKSGYEYTFNINITQDNIKLENFSVEPWAVDNDNVPAGATLQFEN